MNKILKQFLKFIVISGTGWLIDIGVYSVLTVLLDLNLFFSNIIGSMIAITFVFYASIKNVFISNKLSLRIKYLIYFIYQLLLILCVSIIIQEFYSILIKYYNIDYLKILLKIFITPFTMIINFFVLKLLTEKLVTKI